MDRFRKDFPYLIRHPEYVYFDAAASTQKPQIVIDTLLNFYTHSYASVHRGVYQKAKEATEKYEGVRRKLQTFIHAAHPEEIIFTRGTTASLNMVARCYGKPFLQRGDGVLISATEHHSNIVPWQLLEKEIGICLKVIPVNDCGEIILEEYERLLLENVKFVSFAHISNVLGCIRPLKKMIEMAHEVGALVCVDGAQAAAHISLDMQELDADFYAFSSHKMYGPTGVGILYGKKELLEKMPPYEGGGDMIEKVTFSETTFALPPFRFEAGTPMIAEVIGLGAAIDYLNDIGIANIAEFEKDLVSYALLHLKNISKVRVLGSKIERSHY